MNDKNFVWDYVQSCTAGTSAFSDCSPVWQLGVIGALLVAAVAVFCILVAGRVRGDSGLARLTR